MDELVRHCLRELSFDGDLGCNIDRLRDFIVDYYAQPSGTAASAGGDGTSRQTVDDAFCAFVWSLIVQHPGVRVGNVPPGISTEVYIAPQVSAKRKAKAKGEELAEAAPATTLVEVPDARTKTFDELRLTYGESLRIAVDPQTTFVALAGSETRPSKLTPMVYTALQLITRGRERGIPILELGQKSGYDQKTCFYLVKQLQELNLVVKRKRPGNSTNLAVHKYFFDRSPVWRQVVAEEVAATNADKGKGSANAQDGGDGEPDEIDQGDGQASGSAHVHFDPIDSRHLSSMPLIKARLVKLLESSPHNLHISQNLLIKIGFADPDRTQRRFFRKLLKKLVDQGVIENVRVPHANKKLLDQRKVPCIRLLDKDAAEDAAGEDIVVDEADPEDSDAEGDAADAYETGVKMSVSVHRQISDLLTKSATEGLTLSEISAALGDFDRRTIELLLTRLEQNPPAAHLADIGIAQFSENKGRERRYKYLTVKNFPAVAEREKIEEHRYGVDLSAVGGFLPVEADAFYQDVKTLNTHVDGAGRTSITTAVVKAQKKAGGAKLPDVPVKRGRPRKSTQAAEDTPKPSKGKKRKRDEAEEGEPGGSGPVQQDAPDPPTKRKRGRPSKADIAARQAVAAFEGAAQEVAPAPPKKRGRPPKNAKAKADAVDAPSEFSFISVQPTMEDVLPTSAAQSLIRDEGPLIPPPSPGRQLSTELQPTFIAQDNDAYTAETLSTLLKFVVNGQSDLPINDTPPTVTPQIPETPSVAASPHPPAVPTTNEWPQTQLQSAGNAVAIPIDPALQAESDAILASRLIPTTSTVTDQPVAGPSTTTPTAIKRDQPDSPAPGPPGKRTKSIKTSARKPVNVSQARREQEIVQMLAEAGGIMLVGTKDFYRAHGNLVETLAKAGTPTSLPPGTQIDKRTLDSTLTKLQRMEKVKVVTTSLTSQTGYSRPARIAYLPETSTEALNEFLAVVGETYHRTFTLPTPARVLEEHVAYGGTVPGRSGRVPAAAVLELEKDPEKNAANAIRLFQNDDDTIHDALLTEKNTVAQLYGYIVGKAARSRELHLLTIHQLQSTTTSSQVVSADKRIVHISYYWTDIPLATYCSLVSVLQPNQELAALLASPNQRMLPMRDVPQSVRDALQPAHLKSRTRLLTILEFLQVLELVVPLVPSESEHPNFRCTENGVHPTAFDIAPAVPWTPGTAPVYWRFQDVAPIVLWAAEQSPPPRWKTLPIPTSDLAVAFWTELEKVCTDPDYTQMISYPMSAAASQATKAVEAAMRTLRRSVSWSTVYNLSWYQSEYLRKFVEAGTGNTPLQDADGGAARLDHLCWVVSASEDAVRRFFEKSRHKYLRDMGKVRSRGRPKKQDKDEGKQREDASQLVARRAAEAKLQREQTWEEMLRKIHPDELSIPQTRRLQHIRAEFMRGSGKAAAKWESRIDALLKEASVVSGGLAVLPRAPVSAPAVAPILPPPVATNRPDKDVDELITQQGPAIPQAERVKRTRKGKEKEEEVPSGPSQRRHRFLWNRDYDELAQDATVIVKARCRTVRLDWGAYEQVFPAVPRNSVRQRVTALRAEPATDAYLTRLEDKWHDLWVKHRGTEALPDDDLQSATNFDLRAHVKFLRKHIDKNAIRVGFVEVKSGTLPTTVRELEETFEVVEKIPTAPPWEFMWNVAAEEARERQFARQAFVEIDNDMPPMTSHDSDFLYVAEAAVKMALGNPNDTYNAEAASQLLKGVGEDAVRVATTALLGRGVLAKLVRDPKKSKPGRTLKISDVNANVLGGPVPRETFEDAFAFEESLSQQEDTDAWREWPLLASDGDTAFLLELASDDKVSFEVDTTHPQSMRPSLDWNSKKAADDDIETALSVRYAEDLSPQRAAADDADGGAETNVPPVDIPMEQDVTIEHGKDAHDDTEAFCALKSHGMVNCQGCLDASRTSLLGTLAPEEARVADQVLTALRAADSAGLTRAQLVAKLHGRPEHLLISVVRCLADASVPLVFWTGFTDIFLVSASHVRPWGVSVADSQDADSTSLIIPRRWLDIHGRKLHDIWNQAVRAVTGTVLLRPGISQAEIRWRLRAVYDKQEVHEVLQFLHAEGFVRPKVDPNIPYIQWECPPDDSEEKSTFWTLSNERRWYQV